MQRVLQTPESIGRLRIYEQDFHNHNPYGLNVRNDGAEPYSGFAADIEISRKREEVKAPASCCRKTAAGALNFTLAS
jgi:hypothetical protein